MVISWSAPSDNGTPITSYTVHIRKADNTFTEELSDCDGTDATIVSATQCTIPHTSLIVAPFDLQLGYNIDAKIVATNAYGSSSESAVGGGAVILLVPDSPVNLRNVVSITADNQVGLKWDDGYSNGGSVIIDYEVWYD